MCSRPEADLECKGRNYKGRIMKLRLSTGRVCILAVFYAVACAAFGARLPQACAGQEAGVDSASIGPGETLADTAGIGSAVRASEIRGQTAEAELVGSGLLNRASEIRALWVVRHSLETPDGVRQLVSEAQENGFNALFVQVRGRGEAYYESVIDPLARCLEEDRVEEAAVGDTLGFSSAAAREAVRVTAPPVRATFDPLRLLVALAHDAGLEVHAWVNMYFTWSEEEPHPSPRHVINRYPEWLMADGEGVRLDKLSRDELKAQRIEGLYLSPATPAVRSYLTDVVLEIAVNYPVDGIHLDYVRYPGKSAGLDEYSRAEFTGQHVFDPMDFLATPSAGELPVDMFWAKDLRAAWEQWRGDQVTALVSSISRKLRAVSPGVVLSAAVRPDPARAANDYGQDWLRWLEEGLIDMAAPMIYTESTTRFFRSIGLLKRAVPDSLEGRLLAGISLYNQGPRHAAEKIDISRAAALGGFLLFSYDTAVEHKNAQYLPSLKPRILGREALDRTSMNK